MFAESMDTDNVEQIQEFMEESIKGKTGSVQNSHCIQHSRHYNKIAIT